MMTYVIGSLNNEKRQIEVVQHIELRNAIEWITNAGDKLETIATKKLWILVGIIPTLEIPAFYLFIFFIWFSSHLFLLQLWSRNCDDTPMRSSVLDLMNSSEIRILPQLLHGLCKIPNHMHQFYINQFTISWIYSQFSNLWRLFVMNYE